MSKMINSFFIFLATIVLVGCTEKTEKKSLQFTPSIQSETTQINKQTLVDSVEHLGDLNWHSNIEEAFSLAKKENKKLIIMIGEDSCRWCVKMKKRTLIDTGVQEKMKQYMLVSIKRSDKEAVKFVPEFDGNIPSFFFIDEKRESMGSIVGYFNADDFVEYISEIEEL